MTNPTTVPVTLVKLGTRLFKAGCSFKAAPGGIASGLPRGTRKTAIRSMEDTLRALGYQGPFPAWEIREAAPVATAPVAPAPKPEAAPAPAPQPAVAPEITGEQQDHLASVADAAINAALEEAPLVPAPTAGLRPGKFSPLNGLAFWCDVYLAAAAKFTDIEFPGENPRERVQNYRAAIDLVMREANCVGAWDRDPSGTPWITRAQALRPDVFDATRRPTRRVGAKVYDKVRTFAGNATRVVEVSGAYAPGNKPAAKVAPLVPSPFGAEVLAEVAQVRAGLNKQAAKPEAAKAPATGQVVARAELNGRVYLKLDSGRWADAETGVRPEREVRRVLNQGLQAAVAPQPAGPRYEAQSDSDKVAYRSAFVWARRMSAAAKAAGEDSNLAYKVGMCAALRAQGAAPHAKFEADVREAGADEAYLTAQAEAALEWLTTPAAQAA